VARFYAGRGDRPLWSQGTKLEPQAGGVIALASTAAANGLPPQRYHLERLTALVGAARGGSAADVARAEIALSDTFSSFVADLRHPLEGDAFAYVDPAVGLAPDDPLRALEAAARAPTLAAALADAGRMNSIYAGLRAAYDAAPPGSATAALLKLNLDRARNLPSDLGARYVLVNPAAQRLWLEVGGRTALTMPVIVGKPSEATPSMIGVIRYAVLDPYWNVPPDLARNEVAPQVLANGVGYLAGRRLQVLSGWDAAAQPVDPGGVDWSAEAAGALDLHLRQLPGPSNMMGKVKFVLPNPLGVYLHDTPNKMLFAADRRTDSSGCVRLADAGALEQALLGGTPTPDPSAGPEQRVDLPAPLPVYILYLTAQPTPGGLATYPDVYGRDQRTRNQASEPAPASTQ
jgi:murein L,D-transpeptidase YcbB/YkuD